MQKYAVVMPWYGSSLPNYFNLWLKSAAYNDFIDFFIITDLLNGSENYPFNIKIIRMTFDEIKNRIHVVFGKKAKMNSPYKLCDYKMVYPIIFRDYLKEYDYCGFSDFDIIYGNLRNYMDDTMISTLDRYGMRGHFSLIKNDIKMIHHIIFHHNIKNAYTFDKVIKTNFGCAMDEYGNPRFGYGSSYVMEKWKMRTYDLKEVGDLDIKAPYFRYHGKNYIFEWMEGSLYGYANVGGKIEQKEFMYVHFQKKQLQNNNLSDEVKNFYILPRGFCAEKINILQELNKAQELEHYERAYWRSLRFKLLKKSIKSGGILQYIKRVFEL